MCNWLCSLSGVYVTGELRNYYRRCLEPVFAYQALVSFCIRAFWAAVRRIAPRTRELNQPKAVAQARRTLLAAPVCSIGLAPAGEISPGRLRLSVGWLDYEHKPDWFATFPDPEITVSLHRWNWLLRGITDESAQMPRDQGLALMRSWLGDCQSNESFGEDAYSTGERIVNGSVFLLRTGDGTVPLDIRAAFQRLGRQIAAHLEYYQGDATGNHALNNARGLLFSGTVASLPKAVDLAFAIARERLPILVTKDGFLREGSSHYHFLFTRWVLEMRWIAERTGYAEIASFLEPHAKALVQRCWFFLVRNRAIGQWHIPLIGDVSPDFPPSWLLSLPWSRPALEVFSPASLPPSPAERGWASLFGIGECNDCNRASASLTFPDSFWHRIDHGDLTLFIHAAADAGRPRATHRHFDLCGFALYREGRPLLIDCGRLDYTASQLGNYGKGAYAHNVLAVNGLPAEVNGPLWLQERYRAVDVNTSFSQSGDSSVFVVKHNGFARLVGHCIQHERSFVLRNDAFMVEDQITGSGSCDVLLRFHWAPDLDLADDGGFVWRLDPTRSVFRHDTRLHAMLSAGQEYSHPAGLYFPEYGVSRACRTLELAGTLALPATIRNQLSLAG